MDAGRDSTAEEMSGKVYLHVAVDAVQANPARPLPHYVHFFPRVLEQLAVQSDILVLDFAVG